MVASLRPKSIVFEVTDDSVTEGAIVVPAQRRGSRWETRAAAVVLATSVVGVLAVSTRPEQRAVVATPSVPVGPSLATVGPARTAPAPRPRPRRRDVPVKHPKRQRHQRHHRHHTRVAPAAPAPAATAPAVAVAPPAPSVPQPSVPARPAPSTSREFF
jgi:hypothetical protein